jgi:hypothetical protein
MRWCISDRFDPFTRPFADRHYNRQKIGTKQFVPPGRCLVLRTTSAFWITYYPEFASHRWRGAWICSAFRNEGVERSSDLILEAIAATVAKWSPPPRIESWIIVRRLHDRTIIERDVIAMVTFVDRSKVRPKRDPGRCYRRAGFEEAGTTIKSKLIVLVLRTARLPPPVPAHPVQGALWGST